MTVLTAVAAYIGLCRGDRARLGASPDYGYAPGVFVMTQALVVTDVFLGAGGKNDITVNRIVANAVGIAMAIVLAILPPGLYGGNPKLAISILEKEKLVLARCLRLLLDHLQPTNDSTLPVDDFCKELEDLNTDSKQQISKLLVEANDFYSDASKLAALPLWKADPKLKASLDSLKVVESWIYTVLYYAKNVFQDEQFRNTFLVETQSQSRLKEVLNLLEAESMVELPDTDQGVSTSFESRLFVHFTCTAYRKLRLNEERLLSITWGINGQNY